MALRSMLLVLTALLQSGIALRLESRDSLPVPTASLWSSTADHVYRIPALLVLTSEKTKKNRNTVLAFAEKRYSGPSDTGNIDVVMRRSEDGGETWGAEILVCDVGRSVCGNPAPVEDKHGGIHVLMSTNPAEDQTNRGVMIIHSADGGKTWTRPATITSMVKQRDWLWYATGPVHGIRLQHQQEGINGRLVVPCNHNRPSSTVSGMFEYGSHIIYSDDDGKTWQAADVPHERTHLSSESTLVERRDGTLVLNARSLDPNTFSYSAALRRTEHEELVFHEDLVHRLFSESHDGGLTWSQQRVHPDFWSVSSCQGAMAVEHREAGDLLLFSHPATNERTDLKVHVSTDGGVSFPRRNSILIHGGAAGYSDLQVFDDRLLVLVEHANTGISLERVKLAQLLA